MSSTLLEKSAKGEHVVMFAYPAMGHMIPLLSLAESLHERGCRITFVTSKEGADDLVKLWPVKKGQVTQPEGLGMRLIGVGAGTDRRGKNTTEQVWDNVMILSANTGFVLDFILAEEALPDQATELEVSWPKPKAAVCTGIATVSAEACINAGLKTFLLFDTNATTALEVTKWEHEDLTTDEWKRAGSDTTTYDVLIGSREGASSITPELHFSRGMKAGMTWAWKVAQNAHGILLNSSEVLEPESFESMANLFLRREKPVLAIGPLIPTSALAKRDGSWSTLQPAVLDLLKQAGDAGTLFVSFGSFLTPPKEHLTLLAKVLKARRHPFVWSLRGGKDTLPAGYEDEVKDFGVVVPWVDQKALLAHPGIGFVLSHMGWNTWTEASTFGKPLIAWPLGFDQLYNSELLLQWNLGLRFPAAVIFCSPEASQSDPATFETALNLTLDEALVAPTSARVRENAKLMGEKLRESLEKGGRASQVKDTLADFIKRGSKDRFSFFEQVSPAKRHEVRVENVHVEANGIIKADIAAHDLALRPPGSAGLAIAAH